MWYKSLQQYSYEYEYSTAILVRVLVIWGQSRKIARDLRSRSRISNKDYPIRNIKTVRFV